MSASDKDPVLAALPAEVRTRVEQTLASYEDKDEAKRPSLAYPLWPEIPEPGETVPAPPMPRRPPRKDVGPNYCHGSQPDGWVARSIAQSAPRKPLGRPQSQAKPADRPAWVSSASGRWREPLRSRD